MSPARGAGTGIFASLFLAGVLLHAPSLSGGFVWDDQQMIVRNPEIRDLRTVPEVFRHNYFGDRGNSELYRPLVNVSLAVDYHLLGRDARGEPRPFGFRLTNLFLHAGASLLLFSLLRRITTRPFLPEVASLLFLVHPASSEPVGWIVSRADPMALVLLLVTLHLHLSGRRRPVLHGLALLAYLGAMFSKLVAAPAPLFALLVEWIFRGLRPRDLLRRATLWRYGSYLLPIGLYAAVRIGAMGTFFPQTVGVTWREADAVAALFVGGAIVARSAFTFFFPVGLCGDYSADPVFRDSALADLASRPAVAGLAIAALLLVVLAVLVRRRAPWLALGILWAAAGYLPVAQAARIGAVMADRYLYVPAAGLAAALAAGLLALPRGRVLLLVLLAGAFAAFTAVRERTWRDDVSMNEDVLASYPKNADAWNRLALGLSARGDAEGEERAYREGLRLKPGNRYLLNNLGALLLQSRRLPEAERVLRRAFLLPQDRDRQKAAIGVHLGRTLIALGRVEEAERVLREAVECRPPLGAASTWLEEARERLRMEK